MIVLYIFKADYSEEAISTFRSDVLDRTLLLNMEVNASPPLATLEDPTSKVDVGKALIEDGLLLAEKRKERRLAKLVRRCFLTNVMEYSVLHYI